VRGIEYAVADEITALMSGDLTLGAREVRFQEGYASVPRTRRRVDVGDLSDAVLCR
jgi:hypothetical protein